MLKLILFGGDKSLPSYSPFCLKAMCLLSLSGQAWAAEDVGNPSKLPYGRVPVLKDGNRMIPDSSKIQGWLEDQGADFDAGLTQAEKAQGHALIRMTEESLRYGLVHDRWLVDANWQALRDMFFGSAPAPIRGFVASMVRRRVRKMLTLQGTAQFSEQDRTERLGADIRAIADTLGGKPFLFREYPTSADAAVVPVLDSLRQLPHPTPLGELVSANLPLMAYVERGRAAMYPTE